MPDYGHFFCSSCGAEALAGPDLEVLEPTCVCGVEMLMSFTDRTMVPVLGEPVLGLLPVVGPWMPTRPD